MDKTTTQIDGYSLTHKMRKIRRECPLTSTEQALYYELIAICNEGDWKEVFSVSCAELCYTLQVTTNSLVKARMSLINANLISYKSGKSRRQFSTYSFITVSNFDIDVGTDKGTDRGTDKGTDVVKKLTTIINNTEKKTKRKQKVVALQIIPTLEDVRNYFDECGYTQKIADTCFSYYNQREWRDKDRNKVMNWKNKVANVWFKEESRKPPEIVSKTIYNNGTNKW